MARQQERREGRAQRAPPRRTEGGALADGRLLSIGAAQALFSLLGTTYGGDGQTTFALPNLSGLPANYIICISGDFPQA
ncbi:MAG: phage tail protein [Acidobacteria bacterium]|nr:phage tail protein [Acidobacteriota bacterium]